MHLTARLGLVLASAWVLYLRKSASVLQLLLAKGLSSTPLAQNGFI